jgi:hypothetical protein
MSFPYPRRPSATSTNSAASSLKAQLLNTKTRLFENQFYTNPASDQPPLNRWWAKLCELYETPAYQEREKRRLEYAKRHQQWTREAYDIKMWMLDRR